MMQRSGNPINRDQLHEVHFIIQLHCFVAELTFSHYEQHFFRQKFWFRFRIVLFKVPVLINESTELARNWYVYFDVTASLFKYGQKRIQTGKVSPLDSISRNEAKQISNAWNWSVYYELEW